MHTRAHLYRAILEGLAYALREGKERTEKRSGVKITDLRIAGGGSQSNAAMQLTADVFGMTAVRPRLYEASGLGAAIDAAIGVKLHPDFKAAVSMMTHPGERFEPNPKTHAIYDELYREVYLKMYNRLRPLYRTLRRISTNDRVLGATSPTNLWGDSMTTQEVKRKLTAILSADVKGYSRLMGEDEEWTVRTLSAYREIMSDLIQQHRGRVVDTPGDNVSGRVCQRGGCGAVRGGDPAGAQGEERHAA